MLREPTDLARVYTERPDHRDFRDCLYSASDPEKAKEVYGETLYRLNMDLYREVRNSGWFFIDRADGLTVGETVRKVAGHFGLSGPKAVSVEKAEKDTPLAEALLRFVEACSWTDVKDHLAGMIRNWEFAENEAIFAAVADGKVIGVTTLLNTDYYPLPEIFPWVSCVFVTEAWRGRRVSGLLIDRANAYAGSLGYKRTYIPSPYFGLYEKYGYRYVKDIVNYGGDSDHLFVKEV